MHPSPATRPAAAQALSAGVVIAGKYAIVRVLGAGGMGIVDEANRFERDAAAVAAPPPIPSHVSAPPPAAPLASEPFPPSVARALELSAPPR